MCVGHGWHPPAQALYLTRVKQNIKLIHQGGLHNHGNNDTHTCSVPIETKSRLNLTVYDSTK